MHSPDVGRYDNSDKAARYKYPRRRFGLYPLGVGMEGCIALQLTLLVWDHLL